MPTSWHLSLLQIDVAIGEPEINKKQVLSQMMQAVTRQPKPDILVLPELWNTGYALEQMHELADRDGEETRQWISRFCQEHHVHVIAGSIAVNDQGRLMNTSYVFNRQGEMIQAYSKIHLFRLMDEHKYLTAGEHFGHFHIEGVPCGVMICYDIRFPEQMRSMVLAGAKVIFVPAQWPNPRLHHWRTLLQARAIENQVFIIACNRVGISAGTTFFGHSLIIDPWGEIIAEGNEETQLVSGSIDLTQVDEVRATIPVFEDRRPHLYQT